MHSSRARIIKQDARIEGITKTEAEPKALDTDLKKRMLSGADFRN